MPHTSKPNAIWGQTAVKWIDADWTWGEREAVEALREVFVGGGVSDDYGFYQWQQKHPERKRHLIKLICRINGVKYEEEKEKLENAFLKIEDVEFLLTERKKAKVTINIPKIFQKQLVD